MQLFVINLHTVITLLNQVNKPVWTQVMRHKGLTNMIFFQMTIYLKSNFIYHKLGFKRKSILHVFWVIWYLQAAMMTCFPGKDPLPDKVDGKDINSVAGVLKLYFRELREPLFPTAMFDRLIDSWSAYSFSSKSATVNPLTVAIRGSGYKLFVKGRRYPGARLERYLQNGVVIRRPG